MKQVKKPTFKSWKLRNFHVYAHDQTSLNLSPLHYLYPCCIVGLGSTPVGCPREMPKGLRMECLRLLLSVVGRCLSRMLKFKK